MIIMTTWKTRPLAPAQVEQMLGVWGAIEADLAQRDDIERIATCFNTAGTSGVMVSRVKNPDSAALFSFEGHLAMAEFIEIESYQVVELDEAMPAIVGALARRHHVSAASAAGL